MTNFDPGDIVSVEFPYSDLQGRKRRPGLVLSGDKEDVLLARITTRPVREVGDVNLVEWSEAGLPRPSTVRLAKLATVDQRLVIRRIGRIGTTDGSNIVEALEKWLREMADGFERANRL
jgi:mRNA interferase MazF